ncbi:hypothetical protein RchiOBHm_Chr1g0327921 [Rosa chinensis]|uniref:Uncharacterized protein n=1 Tax=Rosa chinensis TaxID=74649 RepID=A0A2P6SAL3_ROSCH|nr:hypothetical protein RchiOBHm_Chr1g0327921 [Rosa chinensis]
MFYFEGPRGSRIQGHKLAFGSISSNHVFGQTSGYDLVRVLVCLPVYLMG